MRSSSDIRKSTRFQTFSGEFVDNSAVIAFGDQQTARNIFYFSIDANGAVVPVVTYENLAKISNRGVKSLDFEIYINKHLSVLSSLRKLLESFTGVANIHLISREAMLFFVANSPDILRPEGQRMQRKHFEFRSPSAVLQDLFTRGGFENMRTSERTHRQVIPDSATDILTIRYKEWLAAHDNHSSIRVENAFAPLPGGLQPSTSSSAMDMQEERETLDWLAAGGHMQHTSSSSQLGDASAGATVSNQPSTSSLQTAGDNDLMKLMDELNWPDLPDEGDGSTPPVVFSPSVSKRAPSGKQPGGDSKKQKLR